MNEQETGRPECERPAPPQDRPTHRVTDTAQSTAQSERTPWGALQWVPCTRPSVHQSIRSQLRRRRAAMRRSVPLDCGCPDPWPCNCTMPALTDRWIDAGRDAALHLLADGKTPLLEIEVLRALWRRGGPDRRLAQRLHQLTEGQIA